MKQIKPDFAVIGMGVMGSNIALNFCEKGYNVAVFNRTEEKTIRFYEQNKAEFSSRLLPVKGDLADLVGVVGKRGMYFVMVNAGEPTLGVVRDLFALLGPGAVVADLANSHFRDTMLLEKEAAQKKINFFGIGVSGGEEGARHGPSIMPGGGNLSLYNKQLKKLLEDISAKADDRKPCVTYLGAHGAGHFVKMVHNGIEYADMQLIAETYWFMKTGLMLGNKEISEIFKAWNRGKLESYLIGITSDILTEKDPGGKGELIDSILDAAMMKGTGTWTIQSSLELPNVIPIPSIYSAVASRAMSFFREERKKISKKLNFKSKIVEKLEIDELEDALYVAKIAVYAQGFGLISAGYRELGFGVPELGKIAQIWREGCIIRAKFLDEISKRYKDGQVNLVASDIFAEIVKKDFQHLAEVSSIAAKNNISMMTYDASRNYILQLTSERLPANLIQGQRDYFGSHTYERTDKKGHFHFSWQTDRKENESGR